VLATPSDRSLEPVTAMSTNETAENRRSARRMNSSDAHPPAISAIQRDILAAVARLGGCSGQDIMDLLESRYGPGSDVTRGRLYPNLDDLVARGWLNKGAFDRRTNRYTLTAQGEEWIRMTADRYGELAAKIETEMGQ